MGSAEKRRYASANRDTDNPFQPRRRNDSSIKRKNRVIDGSYLDENESIAGRFASAKPTAYDEQVIPALAAKNKQ